MHIKLEDKNKLMHLLNKLKMMNEKLYCIIILFFSGIPFIGLSYSANGNVETYSNSEMGLEFEFPLTWELQSDTTSDKNCNPLCDVSFKIPSDGIVPVSIKTYNLNDPSIKAECICNTLKEFVKYVYNSGFIKSSIEFTGEVLSDNAILINNNISGWEMQSKFEGAYSSIRQHYDFWTIQNDIGYSISYTANEGIQYEKYLSEVKDMIKSLDFIPIEIPPKKNVPSFLQ